MEFLLICISVIIVAALDLFFATKALERQIDNYSAEKEPH